MERCGRYKGDLFVCFETPLTVERCGATAEYPCVGWINETDGQVGLFNVK